MDDGNSRADASWYTLYPRALEVPGVPESRRPWCVRWVKRHEGIIKGKSLSSAVRDDVESFTATLRSTPDTDEWKIRRASDALRLLLINVYGKGWESVETVPSGRMVDGDLGELQKSKPPRIVPVVLTRAEISNILAAMAGDTALMAGLLYGSGLRLRELITLGIKNLDVEHLQITVREGKDRNGRLAVLPEHYRESVVRHLVHVRTLWKRDNEAGFSGTTFPPALERKYPGVSKEWPWQYVFPTPRLCIEPGTGRARRHHVNENILYKAVKSAKERSGIAKRVGCHTLRHSFVTHLLA